MGALEFRGNLSFIASEKIFWSAARNSYLVTFFRALDLKTTRPAFPDIIIAMFSTYLLSCVGTRCLVVLDDSFFAMFVGGAVTQAEFEFLQSFVPHPHCCVLEPSLHPAKLDLFCVFCVSPGPGMPAHFFMFAEDKSSVILLDILSVHSSAPSFVGATFLLRSKKVEASDRLFRILGAHDFSDRVGVSHHLLRCYDCSSYPTYFYSTGSIHQLTNFQFAVTRHFLVSRVLRKCTSPSYLSCCLALSPVYYKNLMSILKSCKLPSRFCVLLLHAFVHQFCSRVHVLLSAGAASSEILSINFAICVCLFVSMLLGDSLFLDFTLDRYPLRRRNSLLALTRLLHSLVCSCFASMSIHTFRSFISTVVSFHHSVRSCICTILTLSARPRSSFDVFGANELSVLLKAVSISDYVRVRIHSKSCCRYLASVLKGLGHDADPRWLLIRFCRSFNDSIICFPGMRLSGFCAFAHRKEGSDEDYCFFRNRQLLRPVDGFFYYRSKQFLYLSYSTSLHFYRTRDFYYFCMYIGMFDVFEFFASFCSDPVFRPSVLQVES